jgi:hypothetical protein
MFSGGGLKKDKPRQVPDDADSDTGKIISYARSHPLFNGGRVANPLSQFLGSAAL